LLHASGTRETASADSGVGGLHFDQVAPFLRTLAARHRIVGLDIVEIAPTFDAANGITCITAGRLIVNVLGASWAPTGAFGRAAL
jgi:agmatinase